MLWGCSKSLSIWIEMIIFEILKKLQNRVVRQWKFNQENHHSEFPESRQMHWYFQPSMSYMWYKHHAHFQLKIQSVPALILTWSLIKKSSDLIGWNNTSFRLDKIKARDLMYVDSASKDECAKGRKMRFHAKKGSSSSTTTTTKKTAGDYRAFSRT